MDLEYHGQLVVRLPDDPECGCGDMATFHANVPPLSRLCTLTASRSVPPMARWSTSRTR